MEETISNPQPTGPYLDCERLDVYRVAVEFHTLAGSLAADRRLGVLRTQAARRADRGGEGLKLDRDAVNIQSLAVRNV